MAATLEEFMTLCEALKVDEPVAKKVLTKFDNDPTRAMAFLQEMMPVGARVVPRCA
jgi:hypothetical protein